MARSITLTLGAGLGADLGPNFNLTANVGSVTPSTATKTELIAGKSVIVDDLATQVTITSTGTCTNAITQTIPCTITTTTTSTSTTTTTTTAAVSGPWDLAWSHSIPGTGTSTLNIYVNNVLVQQSESGIGPYSGTINGIYSNDVVTYTLSGTTVDFTNCSINVYDGGGTIDFISSCNLYSATISNLTGIYLNSNTSLDGVTQNYVSCCP